MIEYPASKLYDIYYHITRKDNLDSIFKYGLIANCGNHSIGNYDKDRIYLTSRIMPLEEVLVEETGNHNDFVMLTINATKIDNFECYIDFEFDQLGEPAAFYTYINIPPEHITNVSEVEIL